MKYYRTVIFIFILSVIAFLAAYNYFKRPFFNEITELTPTPTPKIINEKVVKKDLNTKQKLAQLLVVPFDLNALQQQGEAALTADENTVKNLSWIDKQEPGFVIYFGDKIASSTALLATKNIYESFDEADYLPSIMVDHEGGLVQRLSGEGFTRVDSWQKIVNDYTNVQQQALFQQVAFELYASGINIVLAPVVDVASNSAVLKTRAAGDVDKLYQAAENFVYIFAQYGVMPVIKHFPGIGASRVDLHDQSSAVSLREEDTLIFSKLLNKFGNIGVMTSHLRLTDKLSGQPCSLSAECLQQFPKEYPDVLLISDDLGMISARSINDSEQLKDLSQVAIEAIRAGNHVLLFGNGVSLDEIDLVLHALEQEYQDSAGFRAQVDAAVLKVLNLKR